MARGQRVWNRQLLADPASSAVAAAAADPEPHECSPEHFDEVDHLILDALRVDGRVSLRSVAESLGVNESTVRRRFDAMRDRGCAWVVTLVAASALGFESEIMLNINVDPARIDDVAHQLSTYVGVRYLAVSLNGSLICEVIMPTTQDVHAFLTQGLGKIEGVRDWQANVELLTLKRGYLETPWWRDAVPIAASAPSRNGTTRRRGLTSAAARFEQP